MTFIEGHDFQPVAQSRGEDPLLHGIRQYRFNLEVPRTALVTKKIQEEDQLFLPVCRPQRW